MNSFGSPWTPSPPRLENISDDGMPMDSLSELHDGGMEPEQRPRCNTWPLPRPENFVDQQDGSGSTKASNQQLASGLAAPASTPPSTVTGSSKKNSSRRNAWGNLSYADLITQAISSATDNRLTLSQIYEWMVQNVPYFKDKGDSNSSAGWKNSIRHNLSLHNRFMRVQNEGTGKSSWWMLNPDAKPGKSVRRRAATMDTKQYEKRRGRAKKRVESLRNAQALGLANTNNMKDATPSPSSSVSEGLDVFPDSPLHSGSFQLSPDFRQRASSNASSVGRLSPIPSLLGVDSDWPFGTNLDQGTVTATTPQEQAALDQLAGSIADELTLQNDFLQGFTAAGQMHTQPPPPYQPPQPYSLHATVAHSYNIQHMLQNSTREIQSMSPASGTEMSPSYPHSEPSSDYTMIVGTRSLRRQSSNSPPLTPQSSQGVAIGDSNTAQTLMGQFMEALNGQTHLDDLNINLEPFQGGLDCNVDEVIKHELSVDGSLDFNFTMTQQQQQQQQQQQLSQQNCYNTTTTGNSCSSSSNTGGGVGSNLGNNSNNSNNNNNTTNSSTDTILSTLSGGVTQSSPAASVVVVQHGQFTTCAPVTTPSWVH